MLAELFELCTINSVFIYLSCIFILFFGRGTCLPFERSNTHGIYYTTSMESTVLNTALSLLHINDIDIE